MQPTRALPPNYQFCYALSPGKNWVPQILLVLLALGVFSVGWQVVYRAFPLHFLFPSSGIPLIDRWGILLAAGTMIVLHENIHALVIWRSSGSWPAYGITPLGFYVNAEGWYFSRRTMIAISAAPLVSLTVLGVLMLLILPPTLASLPLWLMLVNAAGSVNDAAVAAWVFFQPDSAVIHNNGRSMEVYRTEKEDCGPSGTRERIRMLLEKAFVKP